jgi:hypothetical protein
MNKGIIYYTDNFNIDIPIIPMVRKFIAKSGLPIVSVSLKKPIKFGENIWLKGKKRGMYTLTLQIITALKKSKAKYVFFCEHDVLYHKTHFDFTPPRDDTYYYNTNVVRWKYHSDLVITHSDIKSLSGLCCNRKLALRHFKLYRKVLDERGLDKDSPKQPRWLRKLGYEPGPCVKRIGKEPFETWESKLPNVDIRHRFCYTNRKTNINSCRRKPKDWTEITIDDIPGWNLRKLFGKDLYI